MLAACGGGGSSSTPSAPSGVGPTSVPTTRASASPAPTFSATSNPQAFACPTTGTSGTAAIATLPSTQSTHRFSKRVARQATSTPEFTQLAVSYNRATLASGTRLVEGRESALGASLIHAYDYPGQNLAMRVVSVPTAKLAVTEATLRAQAGVTSVGVTGERRFHTTTSRVYTNDPYFTGQTPVKQTPPYSENASQSGQWDMHAIGLDFAFGYSNPGATYTASANALGSSAIRIAIIDTGGDASHPELQSKIKLQRCFVTNLSNVQSTGNFATDGDGHGTDVAGIAAAASNNAIGFTGVGGNALIYAYRVFPTPDDSCANSSSNSPQCSSDTNDIAAAINDAVAQGAKVISMSLGGGSCNAGVDTDAAENAAVHAAVVAGVIVIAASGNSGGGNVDAPGCVTGVIAVGASALNDGVATGTTTYTKSVTGASSANPIEYVPTYSQAGSDNTPRSANAWGIVAPGGDPSDSEASSSAAPVDYLHWIENIWTSTPFMSSASDTAFAGNCKADYNGTIPGLTGTADCRTLIAGTSMSTPHVAGAAALILAVNPSYGTPAAMKLLLCSTADDLGDTRQGCGRLNLYRAMATAMPDTALP